LQYRTDDLQAPPSSFLVGHVGSFSRDPLGFLTSAAKDYGDIVRLRFGGRITWFISDPALIQQILVHDWRNFEKGTGLKRSKPLFGNGLLTSEGDTWRRQHNLIMPIFHRERVDSYGAMMVSETESYTELWRSGVTLDMLEATTSLTLRIVMRTLFNAAVDDSGAISEAVECAQAEFARSIPYIIMLPSWVPTPVTPRLRRAITRLDVEIQRLIVARRAEGGDQGDLLSLLLAAHDDENQQGMNNKQLRDELLTLFLAGHETTALTLAWALMLVAQNPDVEARLVDEAKRVYGERLPQPADRAALVYTAAVVQEALRLYPPAWSVGREAIADCKLGDITVKRGNVAFFSQWVVHRDPRWYNDADKFIPERWLDGSTAGNPRFAYFPFGGGPRVCIGSQFALMEAALILSFMLARFRFELASDFVPALYPAITLRPLHPMRMTISARN
jgi:cytochrome P450